VTQTTISLPPPTPRYAIARRRAGVVCIIGYVCAVDALAALQAAFAAGVARDAGSIPWHALTRAQTFIARQRRIA
jgi:hypothetical protein